MRTFVLVSLFVFSVYKVHAQTYFSKDYHFPLHQAVGGSVFCNINYYSSVSNIIDDVNIPGIKYKWKTVFSNITLNGDILYTKIYNSKYSTYLFKTIKTYNDNYISVGAAVLDTVNYYEDSTQVALIMFDSSGDTIFFKNLLYAPNKKTYGYDICQEADSGFVVCGITNKYSVNMRAMLLRLDKDGNVLWEKTYPNAGDVYAYSLAKAADGGYLLGCTQWGEVL
ncbi:MAG: hypothetical protein HUU48_08355 [Flavobacteriales bacterium]|nr:hypothetical protein [Flavobacteriales bacterium]